MPKGFIRLAAGAAVVAALAGAQPAAAQEVTLKVHHFLPPTSHAHSKFIQPWADKVMKESNGRIKVEIYPAMQLGGAPPQLYDQIRDGVVDVVWTVLGYTPGRFPIMEAFDLPFMISTAEATSQAVWDFYDKYAKGEFKEVHPITFHVHGRGSFHMKDKPIRTLDDLKGAKVRGPTKSSTAALQALGAVPVGMPVPKVPESLSTGVIAGALLPYEVTLPLKVHELVKYHSETGGARGLYTSVFLFGMNKKKYEGLPADLKKVIDANSGRDLARQTGKGWDEAEEPGRAPARARGNQFNTIGADEMARWKAAVQPVTDTWLTDMQKRGLDGRKMLDDANALLAKYSK